MSAIKEGQKVFAVSDGPYYDHIILGIFSTEKKAKDFCDLNRGKERNPDGLMSPVMDPKVVECELDNPTSVLYEEEDYGKDS